VLGVLGDNVGCFGAVSTRHIAGIESDNSHPLEQVDDHACQRHSVSDELPAFGSHDPKLYPSIAAWSFTYRQPLPRTPLVIGHRAKHTRCRDGRRRV
jgi:hypothetical protein